MSDAAPPGGPSYPEPLPPPHGFAALPRWAKIAIPATAALILAVVGIAIWQAADNDADVTVEAALKDVAADEQNATTTTTVAATTTTEPATTTTEPATTTTEPATTTTEPATTTTEPATTTTEPATTTTAATTTTVAPTTTTAATTTTEAPTTTEEATTTEAPTTTEEATTTEAPTTTEEATTTEAPPSTTEAPTSPSTAPPSSSLPVAPGSIADNARAFAAAWNVNTVGTEVPRLSEDDITSLDNGPAATTFISPFSDQVGIVGVVRNDDQSVAEALLVWIPGGDQASSNQLYRDAFDVLVRTVDRSLSADERAALADQLGLSPERPPFPQGQTANANAGTAIYTRSVRSTSASPDTVVISVVDSRPHA